MALDLKVIEEKDKIFTSYKNNPDYLIWINSDFEYGDKANTKPELDRKGIKAYRLQVLKPFKEAKNLLNAIKTQLAAEEKSVEEDFLALATRQNRAQTRWETAMAQRHLREINLNTLTQQEVIITNPDGSQTEIMEEVQDPALVAKVRADHEKELKISGIKELSPKMRYTGKDINLIINDTLPDKNIINLYKLGFLKIDEGKLKTWLATKLNANEDINITGINYEVIK